MKSFAEILETALKWLSLAKKMFDLNLIDQNTLVDEYNALLTSYYENSKKSFHKFQNLPSFSGNERVREKIRFTEVHFKEIINFYENFIISYLRPLT